MIPWYNRPWNYVLRHPDGAVRKKIVELARKAANNDMIGYDQGDRYSFWQQLEAVGYDPSKITVPCESDCSAGVAAIVKAVGYLMGNTKLQGVSIYCYTGNLRAALKAAGFEVLTASKYLASDKYLQAGDVLLYEGTTPPSTWMMGPVPRLLLHTLRAFSRPQTAAAGGISIPTAHMPAMAGTGSLNAPVAHLAGICSTLRDTC